MKYISLDIETTGLDRINDQILQVALVLEDTAQPNIPLKDLPYVTFNVKHDRYSGSAFALSLNASILADLASDKPSVYAENIDEYLWVWFSKDLGIDLTKERLNIAGKNVAGFDIPFLKQLAPVVCSKFRHRVIDPGSVFIDWSKEFVPSLEDLKSGTVSHNAYEDALDVIQVLRKSYV